MYNHHLCVHSDNYICRHELYTTGVSVHIIEPGFFATDILSGGQLRQSWETSYQSLDEERREYYGPEYAEECKVVIFLLMY